MEEKTEKESNEKETYIKDSNVEIIISSDVKRKDTDYWSMAVIAIVMLALAAYVFLTKRGVL